MQHLKEKIYSLLRRSEGVFKTDMVYIVKNAGWLGISQVVISFSAFLMAIAFSHYVSKEAYGEYKYVLSIVGIFSSLTLTGLGTVVVRSVSQGFEGTLSYAFWQNIKWSALFFFGFLCVSVYYFIHGNDSLGTSMLLVGSLSPILKSTNLYNAYLSAKKDFKRSSIYYGIIGNVFPYLCLLIVMMFSTNPLWLVSTYFISNTIIGITLYLEVVKIYKPNKEIDPEMLSYSKHLSFINILSGIASNIDQVLVFHFLGAAQLAIYNFAIAIPNQIKAIPSGLSNIIFPKFAVRDDGDIRESMKSKVMWLSAAGIIITISYILLTPSIFHLFFPKYSDSILYSQISILPILGLFIEPAASYLIVKKKIKEQYILNLTGSIFQILSLLVGIVFWGIEGLVISRVISTFFLYGLVGILYEISSRKAVET